MRTDKWAKENNLFNTYKISDNPKHLSTSLAKIRSEGFEAFIVRIISNPLSRNKTNIYAVYADANWKKQKDIADIKRQIEENKNEIKSLTEAYENDLKESNFKLELCLLRLEELEQ